MGRVWHVPIVSWLLAACLVSQGLPCFRTVGQEAAADLQRFEFTEPQMGVPFRIVLYAPSAPAAAAAAHAAFRRVGQLNEIMSDYETDSELNELSRTAGQGLAVTVSPELWMVLVQAQQLAERTEGAFDVTVGPVVSLWRKARRSQQLPEARQLSEALRAVGYEHLRLDPDRHTVELKRPRMKLDLGGIAKGYALDAAVQVLGSYGITRALVSGGGDMVLSGPPPGQEGWRIEIAPLDVTNAPPKRFARLAHAALATSGDVFQRLEIEGRRYSHIVDPRTGLGLTDHSLVTIIAPDGMTADAFATAVSVLGPGKGLQLVEESPGVEAYLARGSDLRIETFQSRGFQRFWEEPAQSP